VEYSAAVEALLNELGDPVTHVLDIPVPAPENSLSSAEPHPTLRRRYTMTSFRSRPFSSIANPDSPFHTVILVGLVATLSYLAAKLGGALILHPQTVQPLWLDCALLVSVLLLVARRIWPILIPVAFAAFVLYDLQVGVPIRSTVWFILADTVEVLIAALCVSYSFDGVPRLNSVKALAKYAFFAVILAPCAGAFVGALAVSGDYWISWRICFFSEALAFLTLTPAILSWVSEARAWSQKSRADYLEAIGLITALVFFGYVTFVASGKSIPPALFYSLMPFLLWSALRFGSMGVSTSVIVVAFLSIWGAVHGRGPFTGSGELDNVLSLQLFIFFAATPFMVLAALVEEHKQTEQAIRESEERLARVARIAILSELTASIAHEINQPLAAVVTNGHFCLRRLSDGPQNIEELREAIGEIVNDGTRVSTIISRIRALLKKTPLQMERLGMNEVIREVLALTRNELFRGGVTAQIELAADVPAVLGDRVQLQQVMLNLIMNGIDAMSMITDRPRKLLIKSAKNPDSVSIQVQDSGTGFNLEQADRVFEPFFTTKPEGIGMGLSISRSIIESHGGRLWAESGSKGALFRFTLPTQD
jgi:signal transduction histidine kinase